MPESGEVVPDIASIPRSIGVSGDASFAAPIKAAYSFVVMRWSAVKDIDIFAKRD
jgi:hypothetical protein